MEPLIELKFVADTGHCYLTSLKCMNSNKLELSFYLTTVLVLVRRELNFCSGQDPEVILYHLTSLPGVGRRECLLGRRESGPVNMWQRESPDFVYCCGGGLGGYSM